MKRNIVLAFLVLFVSFCAQAYAVPVTFFSEDFGSTATNTLGFLLGVPNQGTNSGTMMSPPGGSVTITGVDYNWYAARFGDGTTAIASAVGLGSPETSPGGTNFHGGFQDDVGLLIGVDTSGYTNVNLGFQWKTFNAESGDYFVAGYHDGDITTGWSAARTQDMQSGSLSWGTGWHQLMSVQSSGSTTTFTTATYSLPSEKLWLAFWINDGSGDWGKIDNINVTGSVVPEPASMLLFSIGALGFGFVRRKR